MAGRLALGTAAAKGAVVLNHCPVTSLVREGGKVVGVVARDAATGVELTVRAKCVVNATGVWVDESLLTPENLASARTLAACVHALLEAG